MPHSKITTADALRNILVSVIEDRKSKIVSEILKPTGSIQISALRKESEGLKTIQTKLTSLDASKHKDQEIIAQLALYLSHNFQINYADQKLMDQVSLVGTVNKFGYAVPSSSERLDLQINQNVYGSIPHSGSSQRVSTAFSMQEADIYDAIV